MITINDATKKPCRTSANLRCIVEQSRELSVLSVQVMGPYETQRGHLYVTWEDGSSCLAGFASYRVMCKWVKARRMFRTAQIIYSGRMVAA